MKLRYEMNMKLRYEMKIKLKIDRIKRVFSPILN